MRLLRYLALAPGIQKLTVVLLMILKLKLNLNLISLESSQKDGMNSIIDFALICLKYLDI